MTSNFGPSAPGAKARPCYDWTWVRDLLVHGDPDDEEAWDHFQEHLEGCEACLQASERLQPDASELRALVEAGARKRLPASPCVAEAALSERRLSGPASAHLLECSECLATRGRLLWKAFESGRAAEDVPVPPGAEPSGGPSEDYWKLTPYAPGAYEPAEALRAAPAGHAELREVPVAGGLTLQFGFRPGVYYLRHDIDAVELRDGPVTLVANVGGDEVRLRLELERERFELSPDDDEALRRLVEAKASFAVEEVS